MKRRHRAKSDILIDLTSLLDIIFIFLLVVLGQLKIAEQQKADQVKAGMTVEEANAQAEKAHADYELYVSQLDMTGTTDFMMRAVTVYCYYEEDNVEVRHVEILKKGDAEPIRIMMRGEDVTDKLLEVKNEIIEYVNDNKDFPVILSLIEEDEKILYRDERAIIKIFEELKAPEYPNVYVKFDN